LTKGKSSNRPRNVLVVMFETEIAIRDTTSV